MSFFEDKLYQFIEELGKEGVGGHEKVEERERIFETSGGGFETVPHELDHETDDPFSSEDFSSRRSPSRLGLRGNASKWHEVRLFLIDLMDYSIERKGALSQECWRKMEKWMFQRKMIRKNGSHFRFKTLSWEEVG